MANDIVDLKKFIESLSQKTNDKIDSLQTTADIDGLRTQQTDIKSRIVNIEANDKSNDDRIQDLNFQVELLKQDRLRNNIRITGLPGTAFNDPDDKCVVRGNISWN